MNTIECKAQWFSRPLTTKSSMSGFEGPAAKTDVDDGFGNPTIRGRITDSYNTFFEETGRVNNSPIYDGTIRIFDTPANRYKLAQHIRCKPAALRVKDRALERLILAENPSVPRNKQPRSGNRMIEMPEDFDGSKVVISNAMVDSDPIEDAHAQVSDAEFTEVAKTAQAPAATDEDDGSKLVRPAIAISIGEAKSEPAKPKATEAPRGFDAKAFKEKVAAQRAAEVAKIAESKTAEAKTEPTDEAPAAAQE